MSIIMHCFREPREAEVYFDKFCKWAQSNTSTTLASPITVEIGILLKRPLDQATYKSIQERMQAIRDGITLNVNKGASVESVKEKVWSYYTVHSIGDVPDLMFNDALSMETLELTDTVPYRYVVAYYYGANVIPQHVVNTEAHSDSYGTADRLRDYLSRRWAVNQKTYGATTPQGIFINYPTQQ